MLDEGKSKELVAAFSDTILSCQNVVDNLLREFFTRPPRVEVRLVEDWTLNAYAAREDAWYVIGIHVGIIPRLLRPFADCLANNWIAAVKDRGRLNLWLLNVAIEFLIFHEVGHIVLGHLEYCETLDLFEFRDDTPRHTNTMDLQGSNLWRTNLP